MYLPWFLKQKKNIPFSICQKAAQGAKANIIDYYDSFYYLPLARILKAFVYWQSLLLHGQCQKGQGILKGEDHCTIDLLFVWLGISCLTTANFCFYL